MSEDYPAGWATAHVKEVVEDFQSGFASGEKNVEGGIAQLRMNNIGLDGRLVLDLVRTVPTALAKPHYNLRPCRITSNPFLYGCLRRPKGVSHDVPHIGYYRIWIRARIQRARRVWPYTRHG